MNIGIPFLEQIRAGGGAVTTTSGTGDLGGGAPPPVDANADTGDGQSGWGWLAQTLSQIASAVTASYHTEHNTNDTHKTIHASGAIYERARTVAIGDWSDVAFAATNFTGSASMTWTVTQSQQIVYSYWRLGSTLYVNYWIENATLGGTASPSLKLQLPSTFRVAQYASAPFYAYNNTATTGRVTATPGDRFLVLYKTDSANWNTASAVTVQGQIAVKVSENTGDVGITVVDPVVTYTGGTFNFASSSALALTTAGTYAMTVNRAMTLTLKATAGGGGGASSPTATVAGGGGGGGGGTTTGTSVSLVTGKVYTLVIGAAGAVDGDGTATTFVNTTDTVTLVSLNPGLKGGTGAVFNPGAGGALITGSNGVTGAFGGAGSGANAVPGDPGVAAANGAGGGGGGGFVTNSAGGAGGNGSASGGTGGAINTAGGNNGGLAGGGGAAATGGGGGGGGGGARFTGSAVAFGGGGGGGGNPTAGTTAGGAGLAGGAVLTFVSAP